MAVCYFSLCPLFFAERNHVLTQLGPWRMTVDLRFWHPWPVLSELVRRRCY